MKLEFSTEIFAADESARTITGQIVPFDKPGNASIGTTVFAVGSIRPLDLNARKVLLNIGHDREKVVGHLIDAKVNPAGMIGTFKIAETTAGNDLLAEAGSGLRTGLSVEAEILNHEVRDNTVHILDAIVTGVAATTSPAFGENAQITKVAASQPDEADEQETPSEETPAEASPEGDEMSETTAGAVEATETPVVTAAAPSYVTTTVRNPINSPGSFLEHSVRATLGDEDSRLYVKAASDTTTTEVAGLVPTPQLSSIWDPKTTNVRPAISAVRTAVLPAAGMTFEIPRVKTAPTVAAAAEKGAFSDTQTEIEYVVCNVAKYAGMQKFDVEVLDRTSPAFFDELVRLMSNAYAKATDVAMATALQAGTLDSTTITLPWDGDELAGFISRGAASIYAATKRFPTGILVTPDQWANLIALNDSSKRPLFNVAGSPSNAFGDLEPGSPVGNVMGLPVYVDPHLSGVADDSIVMLNRDSFVWYEGAGPLQLRTNIVGTGQVEVGYYGYGSAVTLTAGGAFTFNNAA